MIHSGKKKHKKFKEKDELPSFLEHMYMSPEEFKTPPKSKSKHYLGPIFFGDPCKEFQPPLHVLSLGSFGQGQKHAVGVFKQSINELFYDFEEEKKPRVIYQEFHPTVKRKKSFHDPYPHKCPGTKKVFPLEVRTPTEDFGTTTSEIEGETSMEIPLCRFKSIPLCRSSDMEPEIEFIMPSDLREERWKYLSRREQISHAHFPKRFVTVTVKGPNIPASITVTRLQCKRTREYDNIFLQKPEEAKKEKKVQKKPAEEEETETELSQVEEDTKSEIENQADKQSLKSDAFSEGTRSQYSVDIEKKEKDVDEESEGKEGSSKLAEETENGEEGEIENDKTEEGEEQEEEKTEEIEEQKEENPDEEEEEGD